MLGLVAVLHAPTSLTYLNKENITRMNYNFGTRAVCYVGVIIRCNILLKLGNNVFPYGQLYVQCSSVRNPDFFLLMNDGTAHNACTLRP